jgi:hypothetical protein
MDGHQCYHCKQWVEAGAPHDCWTTTERALTKDLSEDLQDAWERLRETAAGFGEQRIYASHHSIMFSRRSCYFFVRPKRRYLEVCIFLDKPVRASQVKRVVAASRTRLAHIIQVRHRDEVETPITDWMRTAYDLQDDSPTPPTPASKASPRTSTPRGQTTSQARPSRRAAPARARKR